jgi:hypothetical protein
VGGGLAEPDARVDPHLADPRIGRGGGASHQEPPDLVDHVVVAGIVLHGAGVTGHVHRDPADIQLGGHRPQRGAHVVDQGGPGRHRGTGGGLVAGVDRQARPGALDALGDQFEHGEHPTALLVGVDRLRAGPCRLPADVDDPSALGEHLLDTSRGRRQLDEPATVGERVGRGVEHAHDGDGRHQRA